MITPSEKGKPFSNTVKRITKEVRMVMTGDQVREALTSYIMKNFREFRGMSLEFEITDEIEFEFEVSAVDEREERDEGAKSSGASTTGTQTSSSDSPVGASVGGEPEATETEASPSSGK